MAASYSTSCASTEGEELSYPGNRSTDGLQGSNNISISERIKICLKPRYQMKKLKNKGAILVLVLNFLVTCVLYYIGYRSRTPESYCPLCFQWIEVPMGLVLPFAGKLADVYFGRYKTVLWSSIIMWISALVLTATTVAEKIVTFKNYFQLVPLTTLGIGFGLFQGSIIQFGVDQLTDASTNEIKSFINWYSWTYLSSGLVANFVSKCSSPQDKYIAPLFLSVALSMVTCLVFLCNHVLIKEPVLQNPFKLICRVVKYAKRHKFPRQRSAFTYCEDDIPSRIDLGKTKYGGPFTTEQVEDVKTFFRVLGLILVVSAVLGISDEGDFHLIIVGKTIAEQTKNYQLGKCSYTFLFTDTFHITVAILIPLNEFLIYPIFHRCLLSTRRYWRVSVFLLVVRYAVLITLVTLSRQHYMKTDELSGNLTHPCIFQDSFLDLTTSPYDYRYYAIPEFIFAISYVMILVGTIEFFCSQVPYSMKGVTVGLFYASYVLNFALDKGILQIFHTTSSRWSTETMFSCGFWYLQIKTILTLVIVLAIVSLLIVYKKRKRDDVLPNEQIFAERYYTKKLQCD